jgi:hypothetical protein
VAAANALDIAYQSKLVRQVRHVVGGRKRVTMSRIKAGKIPTT